MCQRDNKTTKEWKIMNDKETLAIGGKLKLAPKQ